jgi:hypothetical protein
MESRKKVQLSFRRSCLLQSGLHETAGSVLPAAATSTIYPKGRRRKWPFKPMDYSAAATAAAGYERRISEYGLGMEESIGLYAKIST